MNSWNDCSRCHDTGCVNGDGSGSNHCGHSENIGVGAAWMEFDRPSGYGYGFGITGGSEYGAGPVR